MVSRRLIAPLSLRCAVLMGLLSIAAPLTATAHAQPRYASSVPDSGGFVTSVPSSVKITYTEEVKLSGSNISVIAPGGKEVNAGPIAFDGSDRKTLVVPLASGLTNGQYTVNWVSISTQNGDKEEGGFNFGVRAGAPPPVMHVEPASVDVGQMVTISGAGYKPNGSIVVSAGDDDEFVEAGRSDATGTFSKTVQLPPDLPYGSQTITAADGDGAKATQDVMVMWGGWPPVKVHVDASGAPDDMTFSVTLTNRSDYSLQIKAARLKLPEGTSYKSADSGGRLNAFGEATWDTFDLPAHGSVGPLSVVVDTNTLKDGQDVTAWAWVLYNHAQKKSDDGTVLPQFQSSAVSAVATARAGGLQ
jgi:methionine-rich copper-binding protein CopC